MKELKAYETAVQNLTEKWIRKYICSKDIPFKDVEHWWVADEIGGVMCCNDYYVSLSEIVDCFMYDCPVEIFFDWYDFCMDKGIKNEPRGINFKNFIYVKNKP